MKRSSQVKSYPMLLYGISRWTASLKTTYSIPINPRPPTMPRMWMRKPSAYAFKEPGSLDAIRESIDGSYLHEYLSAKHDWSDSMWSCIDWYVATHVIWKFSMEPPCISGSSLSTTGNALTPKNSSSRSLTMPRSGYVHAARQPLKTMIIFSAVPLRRAPATWSCKIFAAQLNKQHNQLALSYGQALPIG